MAFHSTQGPQLGLPQMIQSRPQFGYIGALLVWGVGAGRLIGFNAFNQVLAAQSVQSLYGAVAGADDAGASRCSRCRFAIVGYDMIHLAQRWLRLRTDRGAGGVHRGGVHPLHFPPAQLDLRDFSAVPFLAQLFAAASYQISWSIYVSDYSRYLPRDVGVARIVLVDLPRAPSSAAPGPCWSAHSPRRRSRSWTSPPALRSRGRWVLPGFGKPLLLVLAARAW